MESNLNQENNNVLDAPEKQVVQDQYYSSRTKGWMVGLGVLMLIFVIMPIRFADRLVFLNFEVFVGDASMTNNVPGILKFLLIAPLIFGILLFYFAKQKRNQGINLTVMLMGIVPFLLMFSSSDMKGITALMGSGDMSVRMVLGSLAFVAIFGGSLAVLNNPANKLAGQIAGVGGVIILLSQLIPVQTIGGSKIPIMNAFDLMSMKDPTETGIMFVSGFSVLITTILGIVSAIYSLKFFKESDDRGDTAKKVFTYYLWSFIPVLFILLYTLSLYGGGRNAPDMILVFIKLMTFMVAITMLIPIGFSELLNPPATQNE